MGDLVLTYDNHENIYNTRISKTFTTLFILAPVMKIYKSPIPGLSGFEIIMAVFLVLLPILSGCRLRLKWKNNAAMFLLLFLYMNVITLISALTQPHFSVFGYFSLSLRWLFYIMILLLAKTILNKKMALNFLDFVVMLSCLGMFIQVGVYYAFKKIWTFKIPWLTLATDSVSKLDVSVQEYKAAARGIFRAYSFYLEPAHFVYVAAIGLAVLLFICKYNKYTYIKAAAITFAITLSTSSSGIALAGAIWSYYVLYRFKSSGLKIKGKHIILLFLLVSIFFLLINTSAVQYGINKVLTDDGKIKSLARTDKYLAYVDLLDIKDQIFGVGFGNVDNYFWCQYGINVGYISGWGHLVLSGGWISLILYFVIMLYFFIKAKPNLKIFVIMFFLINYSSGSLFGVNLFYYLSWVFVFSDSYVNAKESMEGRQGFKTNKPITQHNTT